MSSTDLVADVPEHLRFRRGGKASHVSTLVVDESMSPSAPPPDDCRITTAGPLYGL